MTNVIKRSGKEVPFDITKIINAITKANDEVDPVHQLSRTQIEAVASVCERKIAESPHAVHVEDIQDMVETGIMEMRGFEVAQKYVRYRYKRELVRKANTTDEAILALIDRDNEEVKQENSNKNPIINSTQRDYMAGEVSKDLSRRILLPEDIVKAHDEGIIHFHDMDYFAGHETNCFSSKTRFVTSEGVIPFSKCKDGQHVTILDKDGQWRDATVRYFGKQKLYDVTLTSGRSKTVVTCTRNHRWILKDGTVTTNLSVGDSLYPLVSSRISNEMTVRDAEMFALGFVLGDGSDYKNGLRARLCGRKVDYLDIFVRAGYNVVHTYPNGDLDITRVNGWSKTDFLKCSIWKYLSGQDKKMVFEGLLAADGYTNANAITSANPRIVEMIQDISAIAGYHVSSIKKYIHDTNYKKDAVLYYIHFRIEQNVYNSWTVQSITDHCHRAKQDVWCVVEPVTHSFTLDGGIVTGNCELCNLDDMLQNGTVISGTKIDKPHSFYTACNITTQIVAQVASNTYGGQTFTLSHLAPFVDISRKKIRKEVEEEWNENEMPLDDEKISRIVEKRLKNEIKAGIQTIQYQLITLMTCNGQAPFVTMFMYLDEVPEGQIRDDLAMIIEEALNQRIQGVKNEKGVWVTTAFPKIIYVLDEDNITEDSKYWYLTELSARCTAKRMVPDYVSAKVMKELKGDVYPPMGCVGGDEIIQYKIGDEYYTESFERAWDRLVPFGLAKNQPNGKDLYFDPANVTIWDCAKKEYVPMKRIIKNKSAEWLHVTFSNGRTIDCTPDHPFETLRRGVVFAQDLTEEDMIQIDMDGPAFPEKAVVSKDMAHSLGYLCGCYAYDAYDLFPTGIFIWNIEAKKSFIYGYNLGVMNCSKPGPCKEVKILVELLQKSIDHAEGMTYDGLTTYVRPVKKEAFREANKYSYDVTTESEHFTVSGIYSHNCRSFLTADNEENAEGLCNAGNKSGALNYKEGQHKYYGRMNQGVVTINLVDVACSSNGNMDEFWRILDERLELCHKALRCRHERLLGTPSDVAPILWQYGAMARLKKGEPIDKLLFGNYSTISLGYAGLYEMCVRMTGKSHTSAEGHDFAIAVMQRLNDKCAEWRAAENISYSTYGTPLESTVYKFAKCLQKRFGMIPGVTDHNYITNSYHVNVREKIDAFTKLGFESEFQSLSPGGAISYVEVPNMQNNIPAVLAIMKYIYDHIMYAELNIKSDYCMECGYDGEIRIIEDDNKKLVWECPNCGNRDQTKMQVTRRTCGYIGTQYWNQGRTAEIRDRVLHVAQTALDGPEMNANATK